MTRPVSLDAFYNSPSALEKNSLVFEWLCCDDSRRQLYDQINRQPTVPGRQPGLLVVPSRFRDENSLQTPLPDVVLVTDHARIKSVFENGNDAFSNKTYQDLGDGTFMLGLDAFKANEQKFYQSQHDVLKAAFDGATCNGDATLLGKVCAHAVKEAEVMALTNGDFDLATFSWEAALRYCATLYGYPLTAYAVLYECVPLAYAGLTYQILGRHFVTQPATMFEAKAALAKMLDLTARLIDEYEREPTKLPKGVHSLPDVSKFVPVMRVLVKSRPAELSAGDLALMIVGAIVGTVGNVQAAVCIAVAHLMKHVADATNVHGCPANQLTVSQLEVEIDEAMRNNPPAAFLPRECEKADLGILKGQSVILGLGGAAPSPPRRCPFDSELVFGLDGGPGQRGGGKGKHACLGRFLAMPLVTSLVHRVIRLPDLAHALDPATGKVKGLKKTWGFRCDSFPLQYRRSALRAQTTLNVTMDIKPPISDNAVKLRELIYAAAPRIDEALRKARHVHFAWFEFIEGDTKIVLHTVYDGDFDAYIQFFALQVGDLFDLLFEYIEASPPTPVRKFPEEFIALVAIYNRPPGADYLFSAYPNAEVPMIQRALP
jgi:cytochrome P450